MNELDEFKESTTPVSLKTLTNVAELFSEKIIALAKRVKKLESERVMQFEGSFDPAKTYKAGSVVQRQSQTWVALVDSSETPGQSSQWRRLA